MQLTMKLEVPKPKAAWAFAIDTGKHVSKSRTRKFRSISYDMSRTVITACSREAKQFGVKAGMRYEEAKRIIPDMRILVYNK